MRFKYKYEHLDCGFCMDVTDAGCSHALCPHILENLDDLRHDPEFRAAVNNADLCSTFHRPTLIMLLEAKNAEEKVSASSPKPNPGNGVHADFKPECVGCPFPAVGFVCYDPRDSSCLKTDLDAILRREKAHAGRQ